MNVVKLITVCVLNLMINWESFLNILASHNLPSDPGASLSDIGCWTLEPPWPGSIQRGLRRDAGSREHQDTILVRVSASIDLDLIKRGRVSPTYFHPG